MTEALGEIGERVARGAMLDGDALGDAGAAGGVDDVGEIVGRGALRQARRGMPLDLGNTLVDTLGMLS